MRPADGPLGLRRATAMFAVVAWAGAVLVLIMGVGMLGSSAAGPRTTVALQDTVAAGEPLELVTSTSARLVYGAPADLDLASVTCTGSAPSGERELAVATERQTVTDTVGGGESVLLVRVETMPLVKEVTCLGGGLESIGSSAAGNAGVERGFGVFLLLLSPVLVVLGFVARRASRPPRR